MKERFSVYGDYDNKLENGRKITLTREIFGNNSNLQEELELALKGDYVQSLKDLQEQEQKIFEDLKSKLDDWQKIAEQVNVLQLAKKYEEDCKEVESMETTNNEWIEVNEGSTGIFKISNKTYAMFVRVYEYTQWDKERKESVTYKWSVSYTLHTNNIRNGAYSSCGIVADVTNKNFKDKEGAYKYIEGRKKHFSKYFTELYQPIKDVKDVKHFTSCGKLIRGYKIEE